MKLIFAGTPTFASHILKELYDAGYSVPLVLTQPDRRAGRGMKLQCSPVKTLALASGSLVIQPENLNDKSTVYAIKDCVTSGADALVVAAYGMILPISILNLLPCINVHASLLPRWRGAAPIQRAIMAGDRLTGVSIMKMENGLDCGPIYATAPESIRDDDTAQSLHDRLANLGAETLLHTLRNWPVNAAPQSVEGISYAKKLSKDEAIIDWRQSSRQIDRQVRALNPGIGACFKFKGESIKLWKSQPVIPANENVQTTIDKPAPGQLLQICHNFIMVACGKGALLLHTLQRANCRRIAAADWAVSSKLICGTTRFN